MHSSAPRLGRRLLRDQSAHRLQAGIAVNHPALRVRDENACRQGVSERLNQGFLAEQRSQGVFERRILTWRHVRKSS